MSVLLKDDYPIARVNSYIPSGYWVRAAFKTVPEAIDANREKNLLNAFDVKVSNSKKWDTDKFLLLPIAVGINDSDDEFHIQN